MTLSGSNSYAGATAVNEGTLALTGTLGSTAINVASAGTLTQSATGLIGGSASLTNSGTSILAGANTYNGATDVSAGELRVNGATSAASAVSLASAAVLSGSGTVGGTVTVSGGGIITPGNSNSGTLTLGNLTFNGAGTVNFFSNGSVMNTAITTGTLTTDAGTITLNIAGVTVWTSGTYNLISYSAPSVSGTGFGSFALGTLSGSSSRVLASLVNPAGNVALSITSDYPIWTGSDSTFWVTGSTGANSNWKRNSDSAATDYIEGDYVKFNDDAAGGPNVDVDISGPNVSPSGVVFENNALNYTLKSGSGNGIAGSTGLIKSGTGLLTITSTNSYTGGTTLSGGTINVNNAAALGNSSGALTFSGSGGTLQLGATIASSSRNYVLNANGTIDTNSYDLTNSGIISGTGTLTKSGNGTLTLDGTNIYSGGTTISGGTLRLGNAAGLGAAAGSLTVNAGALDMNGKNATVGLLTGSSGGVITTSSNGSSVLTASSASNSIYAGGITNTSGTLGLAKSGTGTLTLTGSNSYSGVTTISAGALNIQNNNALGNTAGNTFIAAGARLQVQGGLTNMAELLTSSNGIIENVSGNNVLSGTITKVGSAVTLLSTSGTLTIQGGIDGTVNSVNLQGAGGGEISGVISTAFGLTKTGVGTWTLSGPNTFSTNSGGSTFVGEGTLTLAAASVTFGSALTVSNAATDATLNLTSGTFNFGASNFAVGSGSAGTIGTVNQTGGAVSFTSGNALIIGNGGVVNTGNYNLSAGTITTFASTNRGIMLGANSSSFANFTLSGSGALT